jgi:hypothetical protein
MRYPTAAPRLRAWKLGAAVGALATASLAMSGVADAQVFVAFPSPTGSQLSLSQAIADANAVGGTNTIVLNGKSSVGNNLAKFQPAAGMTVSTGNLTITGQHNAQDITGAGDAEIDGTNQQAQSPPVDFLTVASGASLTLEGVELNNAGDFSNGFNAAVRVNGTLTAYNSTFGADTGYPIAVNNGGTATLIDSSIDSTVHTAGILNSGAGTVTLENSTISNGIADGIDNNAGTLFLYNSLLAFQTGVECNGGGAQPGTTGTAADGSADDDGTCNVQYSSDTALDTGTLATDNGGPTTTLQGLPTTALAGNPAVCPVVDQRFFPNPVSGGVTQCDTGSETASAARTTTGPTCGTPSIGTVGGVAEETVPVNSDATGFGPEAGHVTDISGVTGAAGFTPDHADAIDGVVNNGNGLGTANAPGGITNGMVSLLNPLSSPGIGTLNVQAQKGTPGQLTFWSFTANDWAGNSTYCS